MTVTLTGLVFLLYCTNKVAPFIQGTDIRITCSVSGDFPGWDKDGNLITTQGSDAIAAAFSSKLQYAADNSSLQLTNLESGDAGTYTCSFSGGGSATFVVTVDVLTNTSETCPAASEDGSCAVTTSCVTSGDVTIEWICTETSNNKTRVLSSEATANATGCAVGKTQHGALYSHQECEKGDMYEVRYHYNVNHNAVTGVYLTNSYPGPYHLCECCLPEKKADIAMTVIGIVVEVVAIILIVIALIKQFRIILIVLLLFVVVFLITIVVWMIVITVNDERETCATSCTCDVMIAYCVTTGVLTIISVCFIIWLLFIDGAVIEFFRGYCCSGGPQTTSPLTTCMATCTTAPNSSPGNTEEKKKSRNNTKFKLQETGNETQTKPRPLPEKPIKAEPLQMKKPSPGIQDNKSSGREDSAVSRSDVQVHHRDHLSDDDHPHNRTQRGLSATIDQGQLPKLPPIDSTEKKSKRK